MRGPLDFKHRIAIDTEYKSPDGERIRTVHTVVARDIDTGREWVLTHHDLAKLERPPFPTGDDTLMIAFAAAAEWGAFLRLGWEFPANVLDLRYEWLRWKNGRADLPRRAEVEADEAVGKAKKNAGSLLYALKVFGIDAMESSRKEAARQLCMEHDRLPEEHVRTVAEYCREDVAVLVPLFHRLLKDIERFPQALWRGEWSKVEALMTWRGIPVDRDTINQILERLPQHLARIIADADAKVPVFTPAGEISQAKLAAHLLEHDMEWTRTDTGLLSSDSTTFREAATTWPWLQTVYDTLATVSASSNLAKLDIGHDDRVRYFHAPFASSSGRHQPSSAKNPFGFSKPFRSIIRPSEGRAVIYCDYTSAEIGIGAAASGDANLLEAYESGDPYVGFGRLAGLITPGMSDEEVAEVRARCKTCFLACNYGAAPPTIARRLDVSRSVAVDLHTRWHRAFHVYAEWVRGVINHGLVYRELQTPCGWRRLVERDIRTHNGTPNPRSLQNFPIQGCGADILRAATIYMMQDGLELLATVHDACLAECDAGQVEDITRRTQACMERACVDIIGIPLRTDVEVAVYPDRYIDPKGKRFWEHIVGVLDITLPESRGRRRKR